MTRNPNWKHIADLVVLCASTVALTLMIVCADAYWWAQTPGV
ncbi:hypothetical protein MXMO3_01768 [Maritalea myrionectae]|uniref:Uncharacterized protein n=1 Tax=Maritalea myrionectae TaxID=454601 RepID=A0A2R4ME93_9HYPH|nr:hypothetical protein MXMO3_01768 [Maritalea myrionectae]